MERPSGLLGQLWDRFGPVDSPVGEAAPVVVVIQAGPENTPLPVEVSAEENDSLSVPLPPAVPVREQESPAVGSQEDLEQFLDATWG
jgi:hypothetical protein